MQIKQVVRRIGAGVSGAAFAFVLFLGNAAPVAAAEYTPAAGGSTSFNKYLIMDAGDTTPNATFSFTVAPGTAIEGTSDMSAILAGIGTPTVSDVTFAPTDSTSTTAGNAVDLKRTNAQRGGQEGDAVQFDAGEKFAVKQATVSFDGISFTEPGIYRYIISETASQTAGIINDTDTDRVLDVVVAAEGNALKVAAYVLHTGTESISLSADTFSDKTDGFTNEVNAKDLKIQKEVTGNQASRSKYFKFTVKCTELNDNDTFAVSLADDSDQTTNDGNADATSSAGTNPASVTGAQLKAGVNFFLCHGQSIVIRGISAAASYEVTEDAEDYDSSVMTGKTNSGAIATVAGNNKLAEAGFINEKSGIIPTGIFMTVIPGIVIIAGGAAGLIILKRRRNSGNRA